MAKRGKESSHLYDALVHLHPQASFYHTVHNTVNFSKSRPIPVLIFIYFFLSSESDNTYLLPILIYTFNELLGVLHYALHQIPFEGEKEQIGVVRN